MYTLAKFISGVAACAVAGQGWSQVQSAEAPPSATGVQTSFNGSPGESMPLEEIVVTALKQSTDLQRTAAAIDVVSTQAISRANLTNIADIANLVPSLNFGTSNGIYTTVALRGVSSQDTTELGGPAVSFSIDGESIDRPLNLSASLFDINRIEVLKGPQGTLYGRNATAGAINIITKKPEQFFSAELSANYGNYDQRGVQGYVNVPLADWLSVRASGIYSAHDGYLDTERGPVLDDEDMSGGRVHVLLTPTSRLSALLTYETIHTAGGGPGTEGVLSPGTPGTLPTQLTTPPDRSFAIVGIDPHLRTTQEDVRAELNYEFDWLVVTDIVGYRTTDLDQLQNILGTSFWTLDFLGDAEYKTLGNELRLSNGAESSFNWQLGYYYFDEDQTVNSAVSVALPFAVRDQSGFARKFAYPIVNSRSNAVFGEVIVPLSSVAEGLSLTGGLRYTKDEKSRIGTQFALDIGTFVGSGGTVENYIPIDQSGRVENSKLTYNAALNWQWTPQNLLYVKASSGYNAGGFTTENAYGPETLKAYEIGNKNRFFDGQFQLNADAYYYDYTDQQVQVLQATPTGAAQTIQNAGASRIFGIELDGVVAITPDDHLRFSADYLDAKFTDYTVSTTTLGATNASVDLAGSRPTFSPRWTLTAGFTHDWRLNSATLTADVHTAYKTEYFLAVPNYSSARQSSYTNTDASLSYATAMFDVTAFVRNIEDERQYRYANFYSAPGIDAWLFQFTNPRTYGVRATVHFE